MRNPIWGVLLLLPAAPPLAAQVTDSTSLPIAVAQAAAVAWLSLLDQSKYDQSWDSSATLFRAGISKADWKVAAAQARAPFEAFGVRKLLSATYTRRLPKAPPGQYVVLQYETKVSRGRTVVETITPMRETNGTWRVSGYYLRAE